MKIPPIRVEDRLYTRPVVSSGTLAPGTQIDRYELIAPIGEGGMAQVWAARQKGKHGFEKLFALKCITPRFAEEPAFRSMFLDEARIAASIEHPNVAQIYDLGELGSLLYLVMEFVDGESLGALLTAVARRTQKEAIVPTAVALRVVADVCAGLHAAHKLSDDNGNLLGVVHRDISPQNILLTVRGDVKVIDFGIAIARDRLTGDTRDGSLKGKLHYMPPEQALSREVGPFSDVFSAGATLYRMLAGRPPFDGGNDAATLQLLVSGALSPPLPDIVPPLVSAIVERALAPDPGDRYSSALAMQTAIEAAMVEEGYVPDVASWVTENLSDRTRDRRKDLTAKSSLNIGSGPGSPPRSLPKSEGSAEALSSSDLEPVSAQPRPQPPPPLPPPAGFEPSEAVLPSISRTMPSAGSIPAGGAAAAAGAPSFVADLGPLPEPPKREEANKRPPAGIGANADIYTTADLEAASISPVIPPRAIAPVGLPAPPPAPYDLDTSKKPEKQDDKPPPAGVMDVRALLARATSPLPPSSGDASPPSSGPPNVTYDGKRQNPFTSDDEPASQPQPKIELARAKPTTDRIDSGKGRRKLIRIAAAVGLVVFLVSLVLLLLPRIVQDRMISTAREAGIELTIERVGIGMGGVALHNVSAKLVGVPGVGATADEIYAAGAGAREIRVRGLVIDAQGNVQELGPKLLDFYNARRSRFSGTSSDPRRIAIVGARLTWKDFAGEGSRFSSSDLGVELDSKGVGAEDIRASVGRFEITTKRTTLGPWAASFDRTTATSRLRLLFDPPVPDGPSALFVRGEGVAPKLTVRIPRSPLARLGIRPEDLSLPADAASELEVKLEVGQAPSMRIEASGRIDLYAARLKGVKQPIDIKVEGTASGLPGKPMDFDKTSVTLGPFVALVTGAITPTDPGFRLDASWRTVPIPCDRIVKAEATKIGPMAAALHEIAAATGVAKVTGNATATGLVKYDTHTPDDATLTFTTRDTCGLSIFGR